MASPAAAALTVTEAVEAGARALPALTVVKLTHGTDAVANQLTADVPPLLVKATTAVAVSGRYAPMMIGDAVAEVRVRGDAVADALEAAQQSKTQTALTTTLAYTVPGMPPWRPIVSRRRGRILRVAFYKSPLGRVRDSILKIIIIRSWVLQ